MGLSKENDFSVLLAQEFTKGLNSIPTSPTLLASRRRPLSSGKIKMRQRKFGGLSWLVTASRPDICARLARIASGVNSSQSSNVYRKKDLVKTAKEWQQVAVLKYAFSPPPLDTGTGRF